MATQKTETKTEVVRAEAQGKLITKLAESWEVEPSKLMSTLKQTAFKQPADKPEVSNEQMMALLVVANEYRLNPFLKQIYAFPDSKNGIVPIVGVDGWLAIINNHPEHDGMEFVEDGDSCECIIYRKDRTHPTKAIEYLEECKRNTPAWSSHPRRMLRHKAIIQCARMAYGLTGIVDPDEGERIIEGEIVSEPTTGPSKESSFVHDMQNNEESIAV